MGVKFTSRMTEVLTDIEQDLDKGVLRIATEVDRVSKVLAPKKTRGLVKSETIQRVGYGHYKTVFAAPYAAAQEAGQRTSSTGKRVVFRHYSTPGTGKKFLERAGEATVKDINANPKKYFK